MGFTDSFKSLLKSFDHFSLNYYKLLLLWTIYLNSLCIFFLRGTLEGLSSVTQCVGCEEKSKCSLSEPTGPRPFNFNVLFVRCVCSQVCVHAEMCRKQPDLYTNSVLKYFWQQRVEFNFNFGVLMQTAGKTVTCKVTDPSLELLKMLHESRPVKATFLDLTKFEWVTVNSTFPPTAFQLWKK